ncbi:MAG: sulfotransferase domain-containing protein [Acidocella sp.]|nr:sulfotransferase domain-containing protein [Acidocella sp.]
MGKIVWLASYPKSGNTWVRAFLHNYIAQPGAPYDINALTEFSAVECAAAFFGPDAGRMTNEDVQRARESVHAALTKLSDDLVFVKTHNARLVVHKAALCTPAYTAGAIYIVRDPRDVALSYAAYLGHPIDDVIDFMGNEKAANAGDERQVFELLSSWSAHARSWAESPGVLLVRYEDLCAAPTVHFGRIVKFLGGEAEPERLARAIAFSDFRTLSAQEAANGYQAGGQGGPVFFRAGVGGQWRDVMHPAQAQRITRVHGEVMRKFGYL